MRAVIQITASASVECEGKTVASCQKGMLVLLGIHKSDTEQEALLLIDRILKLRIFEDEQGKLNLSPLSVGAEILVVSNFTLFADAAASRRPSFSAAMRFSEAEPLYRFFIEKMKEKATQWQTDGKKVRIAEGVFGGDMKVSLINDGPITLILDTEELK